MAFNSLNDPLLKTILISASLGSGGRGIHIYKNIPNPFDIRDHTTPQSVYNMSPRRSGWLAYGTLWPDEVAGHV